MEPEQIKVKVLAIVKDTQIRYGGGLYHAHLRNMMDIDFEILNPVLREVLDDKEIKTRKGINGTLICYNGSKKK